MVFAQIRQKNDKHRAFAQKLAELTQKHESVCEDIKFKMKQFLDLAVHRKRTLLESRASFNKSNRSSLISDSAKDRLLENQFVLDEEELKIRGEIDFNEKIIKERQEELDGAESLINQTKEIAKQIKVKIEE